MKVIYEYRIDSYKQCTEEASYLNEKYAKIRNGVVSWVSPQKNIVV